MWSWISSGFRRIGLGWDWPVYVGLRAPFRAPRTERLRRSGVSARSASPPADGRRPSAFPMRHRGSPSRLQSLRLRSAILVRGLRAFRYRARDVPPNAGPRDEEDGGAGCHSWPSPPRLSGRSPNLPGGIDPYVGRSRLRGRTGQRRIRSPVVGPSPLERLRGADWRSLQRIDSRCAPRPHGRALHLSRIYPLAKL
jgi:hypothetical protein